MRARNGLKQNGSTFGEIAVSRGVPVLKTLSNVIELCAYEGRPIEWNVIFLQSLTVVRDVEIVPGFGDRSLLLCARYV